MTLHEIFVGEELEMEQFDLERIADLIYGWLEGEHIDPQMAHYAGMLLLSLSQRAPDLPEAQ